MSEWPDAVMEEMEDRRLDGMIDEYLQAEYDEKRGLVPPPEADEPPEGDEMDSQPMEFCGLAEVAELIGLKAESVHVMHSLGKLPPHDAVVGNGRTKLWRVDTILRWDDERPKRRRT